MGGQNWSSREGRGGVREATRAVDQSDPQTVAIVLEVSDLRSLGQRAVPGGTREITANQTKTETQLAKGLSTAPARASSVGGEHFGTLPVASSCAPGSSAGIMAGARRRVRLRYSEGWASWADIAVSAGVITYAAWGCSQSVGFAPQPARKPGPCHGGPRTLCSSTSNDPRRCKGRRSLRRP